MKSTPIICEAGNAAVDLARVVRKRGRRQISELAEFCMISQQRGSDKRYLTDKDPVWIIRGNKTTNLDTTKYRVKVDNYFSLFTFIDNAIGVATRYGLEGPGIESGWGTRFPTPVYTGSGAHPASCKRSLCRW